MSSDLPAWAVRPADATNRQAAVAARQKNVLDLVWESEHSMRTWAHRHGWPTPWLSLSETFLNTMLDTDEAFALVLQEPGVQVRIPVASHTLTADDLRELDEAYEERSFRWLVDALREIRRAVEAGVTVHVEDATLTSFQTFYTWAHGRYHLLEDDGNTAWVGDDSPHP